ncbi:hypothetical protein ABZV41_29590, partial [Streptomyces sp. NPDC005098]|uniref:hypothetical protein n=1 Tax=Streptomyces sp. NPDC005098 TaxID=3154560 RepID=UPI0033A37939
GPIIEQEVERVGHGVTPDELPLLCPGPRRDAVRLPDNGLDKEAVDIRIMERQPCQFVRLKESL